MSAEDLSYAMSAGMSTTYYIISLVVYVLLIVAWWKIFQKAGEAGWKSLIPIYNLYILFKIVWGNGWMCLLMLIPCVNIVIDILMSIKLAKAFGKGTGFGIGLIFLPNIFALILGFGDAQYIGPQ